MKKIIIKKLRIIGGKWRSREISFPVLPELRPTQDRIRETIFNWLAPYVEGAVCLDLFAGSGALGFEALSRGAAKVVFIDHKKQLIHFLQNTAKTLDAQNADIILGTFPDNMPVFRRFQFNIVFIDPPFAHGLVMTSVEWLEKKGYLKDDAFIYIEIEKGLSPLPVPNNWELFKHHKTQTLEYMIYQRSKEKKESNQKINQNE